MKLPGIKVCAALIGFFPIGVAATAHAVTYDITASGGKIGALPAPGYGTVDVTTVGSDLEFSINLAPNWLVETGNGTHLPIEFDLATSGLTISSTASTFTALPSPFSQASGSSFTNPGFNDPMNYGLACGSNGSSSCGDTSSLTFYVLGAGGLQPLLVSGVYLTADIFDKATGQTGTVGAVPATPLPAALPLFATALGLLGLLGWRSKRRNAAGLAAV